VTVPFLLGKVKHTVFILNVLTGWHCTGKTGRYYSDCCEKQPIQLARNKEDAVKLWHLSQKLTGLKQE
jgi:hypothetical protein